MAISVATTRQALADAYKLQGSWVNACPSNPGTTSTPASEASGGAPANARKQTTWSSQTGGVVTGSAVTVDVAPTTYGWILLASAVSGNNMVDSADVVDVVMSAQGQIVITPTYTQT